MKNFIKNIVLSTTMVATAFSFSACSLDEENPGGFTMDNMAANSLASYQTLVNQIYFGMERQLYGTNEFLQFTEGDTDLWTSAANVNSTNTQFFWYYAGTSPNITYTNALWNSIYDGIGSCNMAIVEADNAPFKDQKDKNYALALARFMRAIYYFNAVEQFGAVTLITAPAGMNMSPGRTDPLTIYREIIIPDLEFAVQHLEKGTDATCTTPTKKSALGFLAKACLQTREYGTDDYLQKALDTAKLLIADCEAGGPNYGAYMYPTFEEVFDPVNNFENKEALWKHRWYSSSDGHGSSNGAQNCNRNHEKFLCQLTQFGARIDNSDYRQTYEGCINGIFMPTYHLLNLFVQEDGTLDPRFHASFTTEWNANNNFEWDASKKDSYRKDASVVGQRIAIGEKAIKIVMPQDADYATEIANKATSKYLLVDYKDVYSESGKNVIMNYGGNENVMRYFYPSLKKHNSDKYYVVNASKNRIANLSATFMMRMAEVYLIAAEACIYLNTAPQALPYINKVRMRAGAKALAGTPTIRTVIDERGRELCGEYNRFYDLKRTGFLKDANYLKETHPDLGQFFKSEYALRPIPQAFTQAISNGADYQNPGY